MSKAVGKRYKRYKNEVIKIARKKKGTRKFTPRNEFRFNFGRRANNHPHYVFGEKNGKYKSIGLTTTYPENIKHYVLKKNPEPNNLDKAYMILGRPFTEPKSHYGQVLKGWSFHKEDMPMVRHHIKKYKKSYNRKKQKKK